jgi:hypothetical protein
MAVQLFIVSMMPNASDEAQRDVQALVRKYGGFMMMTTGSGPIIAIDDANVPAIRNHPQVRMVGGVTLNPEGLAVQRLKRIFAENINRQLTFVRDPQSSK